MCVCNEKDTIGVNKFAQRIWSHGSMAFGGYSQISCEAFGMMIAGQANNNGLPIEEIETVASDIIRLVEDRFECEVDQEDKRRILITTLKELISYGYALSYLSPLENALANIPKCF